MNECICFVGGWFLFFLWGRQLFYKRMDGSGERGGMRFAYCYCAIPDDCWRVVLRSHTLLKQSLLYANQKKFIIYIFAIFLL